MALESIRQKNIYRGPSSSAEFNKRNAAILKDIHTLYEKLNENEESIEESMDIVLRENFFLQNHVSLLRQEIEKLQRLVEEKEEYESDADTARNIFVQNFYQTNAFRNGTGTQRSTVDRQHGVVFPAMADSTSKFSYLTDNREVFFPSGLQLFLKEAKNTVLDSEGNPVSYDLVEPNANQMLDRDKNTFWIRTVGFDQKESVTEVFGELHIKLPTSSLNNLYANRLTIHPYPEGSMRIRDIQYKGYGDRWMRLPNYPTVQTGAGEIPFVFENARKLLFQFGRTEMTELRIFYSQPYWFESGNQALFTYGFQDIDLSYGIYTEKSCEFVSVVDLSDKNAFFDSLSYPEALAAKGTDKDLTNLVEHHLYYDEALSEEFDFDESILMTLQTVYIKTVLKKEGDDIPVLKEIRFPYTFKRAEGMN